MGKTNSFLLVLCALMLVLKITSIYFTSFDLFGDEAQYWLWSKNVDFGYFSKPPFLSWVIFLTCWVFGSSIFVLKMISVFFYCLSSYIIFLISKKLFKKRSLAFFIATTFYLMPAVSLSSFLLSTDVLLVFFWSASLLQLLNLKDNPNIYNFIILGILLGLAFLAKYAAIYFLISLAFLFFEKEFKKIYLSNLFGLFCCAITILLVTAPNILWNINNEWVTLHHTSDNASLDSIKINLNGGLMFILSQFAMLGPVIVVFFLLFSVKKMKNDFNFRFLIIFSLPALLIVLVESILVRANANWAAVSLVSLLILIVYSVNNISKKIIIANNIVSFVMGFILFVLIATSSTYEPFKRITGITLFANSLLEQYLSETKEIVVSDRMLFSSLSYAYRDKKIKIYMPYKPGSKISNHFQISNSLPKDFNNNFIFIGYKKEINYLKNAYVANHIITKEVGFINNPIKIYEITF